MLSPAFCEALSKIHTMIVHPGNAHMDDFLSVALVLSQNAGINVFRREPTPEEIADPHVLVADVGGVHNPALMCFDHHQDQNLPASFVLILKAAGIWDIFTECFPWAIFMSDMDTQGPTKVCRARGIPEGVGREFMNPIVDYVLSRFENSSTLSDNSRNLIHGFGCNLMDEVSKWETAQVAAQAAASFAVEKGGQCYFLLFSDLECNNKLFGSLFDRALVHRASEGGYVGTITRSVRNHGWRLYRVQDNPHVDFRFVKDDHRVYFAHANGFLAETHDLISVEELHTLIEKAIVD